MEEGEERKEKKNYTLSDVGSVKLLPTAQHK
jgi:hypothetical protein